MKIANQDFKHLILVGLIISTSISESFGQVITRVSSPEDKIENYIPWYNPEEEIPIVIAPFVDVESVLLEDQQTGREMPRIGIKQDVNYTVESGKVVRTLEAYSDNFKLDMSDLPSGLYVLQLNVDGTIFHEKIVKL